MADRTNTAKSEDQPVETPDVAAAREELEVLERLSDGVSTRIAELARRPKFEGKPDNTEVALQEHKYHRLKAFEELADRCYGRAVTGTEVDEHDRPRSKFTYRITQANIGYVEGGCFVIARNSPLATALVTAQPGDEREITVNQKDRFLNVGEVRTVEGPTSLRSPIEKANFRLMTIRRPNLKLPIVLKNIRSVVYGELLPISDRGADTASVKPTEVRPPAPVDTTWLNDWSGVYFGEAEEQSLGHQFFTQTTLDQERALNNPFGLTFVEGIAGSGKTSVALGRVKFFANFATGAEREHYNLQNASEKDFAPIGMVGFVLSHSLKRYLKETASALGLERLPIRDFEEFRTDLYGRFGIAEHFKRKKGDASSVRSRVRWLRALDAAVARATGAKLRENVAASKGIPKTVADEVLRLADVLGRSEADPDSPTFHLSGLMGRLVGIISDAELRHKEAVASEEFRPRARVDTEQRRLEQLSLEREMRRIEQEAEKRIVSPLALSLVAGVTAHELVLAAIFLDDFPALVRQSFGNVAESVGAKGLNDALVETRQLFQQVEGRRTLDDSSLVALTILAAMIAEGFDYIDLRSNLRYLYQVRRNTAVFIDEVQDFSEIEVVLMGMTAMSNYNQITLSGDRFQRLQLAGAQAYEELFPWVPRNRHNRSFFLDHNFRQRPELATLSAGFRSLIQRDSRVDFPSDSSSPCAAIYKYSSREHMSEFILQKIRSAPQYATIAVIAPTTPEAQIWHDLLEQELSSFHRPALMSRRDDLTRRFNVHFTEVRETKGLEFNIVIVPDLGSFALDNDIGRNQAYVAISRSKHALVLGCSSQLVDRKEIAELEKNKLLCVRDLPLH